MPSVNLSATGKRRRRTVRVLLAALLATAWLAACGGDDEPESPPATTTTAPSTPTSPAPSSPAASPTEEVELLEFAITGGEASPPVARVEVDRGTTVRIVVTSDQPDEIHLHGYELSAPVGPGEDGVIEFAADQTGLFELETHETGLVLAQLQVR